MAHQAPGVWVIAALVRPGHRLAGMILLVWPISGTLSLTYPWIALFLIEGFASIVFAIESTATSSRAAGLDTGEWRDRHDPGGHRVHRAFLVGVPDARLGTDRHGIARPIGLTPRLMG